MQNKKAIYFTVLILIAGILYTVYLSAKDGKKPVPVVTSFETCASAGYPVMESFPRQCKTPDGRTYAEEIKVNPIYTNSSSDLIVVDLPFPGAVTGKEFTVKGKARGTWFFEASFPIMIVDKNGAVLGTYVAKAQSDWMTTDFVPFSVDVKVPQSYMGPAALVLKKDNPSGDPSKDASLSFPITIEY
jgi:hypothetical protein